MKTSILIYDDDPEILMVCKIILERRHHQVATRLFCDQILEDISEVNPEVILMDLWIPSIGGEQAVMLIKNNEKTAQIRVILFSANTEVDIIAKKINADGVLRKPFEIQALLDIVENAGAKINVTTR